MHTNKVILMLCCTVLGLLLGWFFFADSAADPQAGHAMGNRIPKDETGVWTCSMHPQIRMNEFGLCPICGMDLIPAGSDEQKAEVQLSASERAQANVRVETVQRGKAYRKILLPGTIEVDERRTAVITGHIPHARIEHLYVNFVGDYVGKADKVAAVYSPDLITVQKELFEARRYGGPDSELAEMARNKLRYWKLTEEQIRAIESSGVVQEVVDIYAHRSGYVSKLNVAIGDHVREGQVVAELAELGKVWLILDAYERDLSWIKIGNTVEFTVPAMPERRYEAQVSYIDPVLNPATSTVRVRAESANPGMLLKPGMLAEGTLYAVTTGANELIIPKSAVLWTGRRSVVFVESEEGSYGLRTVQLGPETENGYIVREGLADGARIVTNGTFMVDAAAQLRGYESMMNRQRDFGPDATAQNLRIELQAGARARLAEILDAYFALSKALVDSDAPTAQRRAAALRSAVSAFPAASLPEAAQYRWLKLADSLQAFLGRISMARELGRQRATFENLSAGIYEALQMFGTAGKPLYRQHCPMAFNDAGAYWLSASKDILNPYFGKSMLRCGEVVDSLQ